jgi:hypothetical protein
MTRDQSEDATDDVSLVGGPIDADLWAKVTKETPRDDAGFALSIGRAFPGEDDAPNGVWASIFTDAAVDFAESRYDVDDYEDGTPVGVLLIDTDAVDAVFVGLGDIVAADVGTAPDVDDYEGQGKVAVIGRSGETLRLKGVGAVDVGPEDVIEVTDRVEYQDEE